MPSKTTTALAILLVFGFGSAALAQTNNRTSHHGSVARRAVPVTMPNGRNGNVRALPPRRSNQAAAYSGLQIQIRIVPSIS